jgi:hypothetical protein
MEGYMKRKKFKSKIKIYVKVSEAEVVLLEKSVDIFAKDIEYATDAIFTIARKNPFSMFDDIEIEDFVINNFSKNSKLLCEVKEVKRHG